MFNYSKNSILACKLAINNKNKRNFHIVKCPKLLPCGYTCCLDCIKSLITDGSNRFQCVFCKKIHRVPKDLERNVKIEHALDNSLEILVKEFSAQLRNDVGNLKETLKDYERNVEKLFEFISEDIEISVESMKVEVDNHKEALFEKTFKIRDSYMRRSNRRIEKVGNLVERIRKSNDVYVHLNEFSHYDVKFVQSYEHLSCETLVGTLNGSNIGDLIDQTDMRKNDAKTVSLKFHPYDICNCFNEYLAVTDRLSHKVHLLNKKFQLYRTIASINNEFFNSPSGLCVNNASVFLCDSKNQRVLVINTDFSEIKLIIKNTTHFEEPQNICCDLKDESIYVLDVKLNSIVHLTSTGEAINEFSLEIKNPICMKFVSDNCQLVINSNYERVLVCNANNGQVNDVIENFDYSLGGLFYAKGNLYAHQANGVLICLGQSDKKWSVLFDRVLLLDSTGTWSSCEFNKHLVFSSWNKSLLII